MPIKLKLLGGGREAADFLSHIHGDQHGFRREEALGNGKMESTVRFFFFKYAVEKVLNLQKNCKDSIVSSRMATASSPCISHLTFSMLHLLQLKDQN